jgi:hypothetical protein
MKGKEEKERNQYGSTVVIAAMVRAAIMKKFKL